MVVTFINHSKAAKFTLNLVICIKSILSCLQVSFFWKQTHIFSFDLILTKIGTISIVVIIIVFQRKRNPIQLSKQAINRWMDLLSKKDAALQQNLLPECLCPHFPIMPANYHYLWTDPIYYSHQHHKHTGRETQYQPCVSEKPDNTLDGLLLHYGRKTKIEAAVSFGNRYPFGMACK